VTELLVDPSAPAPALGRAPTVSVVVCAFTMKRAALLAAAVGSLQRQTRRPDEVIVVIDHAPALHHWAQTALGGVTTVHSGHARGLSGARNSGVGIARGEVVAFLDDDAVAAPDWIERLQAAYVNPSVVGAGGAVLPAWEVRRPRWMPEEFDWVVGCSYRGLPDRPAVVRNLIGCNMSFRRGAIERIGGFAAGLGRHGTRPLGCEETDLCLRLATAQPGATILFDPATTVRHHVGRSRATLRYFVARCHAEGLSKAEVVRRSGARSGLANERRHALRTLPRGVITALRQRNPARACAIVIGFAVTAAGYATGRLAR